MAEIFPFRGLRYHPQRVGDIGLVTAPPYDVIDGKLQQALYDRHAANVVRLILNKKTPTDHRGDNSYTRAADFLKTWEAEGILQPDPVPTLYAYSQTWLEGGHTRVERKGIIGLLKLERFESGVVLPHEFTLKGPKVDRLELMRRTLANLSQIFMVYADPNRQMETVLFEKADTSSWITVTEADGVQHQFHPVTEAAILNQLQKLYADLPVMIADGHHRYETALAFQQEVRERLKAETGEEPPDGALLSDYIMVFLCNIHDPGLRVYPTDRVLYQWPEGWNTERFESALLEKYAIIDSGSDSGGDFYYQTPAMASPWKLKLKDSGVMAHRIPALRTLDTALLEETVFQGLFGQSGEALKQAHLLGFYRDEQAVQALLKNKEAVAVFYMNTPPLQQILEVCQSGERMPQKSTYFYPKILSGLVFYQYAPFLPAGGHALDYLTHVHPVAPELFAGPSLLEASPLEV